MSESLPRGSVVGALFLAGCALIDTLDDSSSNDGPPGFDATAASSCDGPLDLGRIDNRRIVRVLDTCSAPDLVSFSGTCGNGPFAQTQIFELSNDISGVFEICVTALTDGIAMRGFGDCNAEPAGVCTPTPSDIRTCYDEFIEQGQTFIYWQPTNGSCGQLEIIAPSGFSQ